MDLILGIIFMVIVGTSWSLDGYVIGQSPKKGISAPVLIFVSTLTAALIAFVIGICSGGLPVFNRGSLLVIGILVTSGIFNTFQLRAMAEAMQRGPNGIIWTITQSGFIFPFAMGVIFFSVPLTWIRSVGMVLIITALVFFGISRRGGANGQWKMLALTAFLMTGFSQSFSNLPSYMDAVKYVPSVWRTCAASCGFVIGSLIGAGGDKGFISNLTVSLKRPVLWAYVGVMNIFSVLGSTFLLYPGMDKLEQADAGAIAYPMMVCSSLISFELFTIIFFKEKRSPLEIIALILCLAGVAGICF